MSKINPTDIAVALKKAWTKSCGERPLDTRDHVLACSDEGNEKAAGAFLDAAGDAWWVPLFRERSEAAGQAVLETPIQEESDLEHYLEVAALVPSLRDAALDRFEQAATSWVEALPQGHYTQGMHIGRFAELAPGRARSFVARFPALLEPRGIDLKGRQPAALCVARLLSESFAETMPLVAT
ncbi:MAG: hypothetical protein JRH11_09035, partial [Deltaproteobacteria bacterium]|nr:hypothetical protein [Deltaproteobacteria bacterium]